MLNRLLLSLVALSALAAAENRLRSQHDHKEKAHVASATPHHEVMKDLPINNERGSQTHRRLQKRSRNHRRLEVKKMKSMNVIDKKRTSMKEQIEEAVRHKKKDKRQLSHDSISVNLNAITNFEGWAIQRTRPNADCSGRVIQMGGMKIGDCHWDATVGYSWALGCSEVWDNYSNEGKPAVFQAVYSSYDCTGTPWTYYDMEYYNDFCTMDLERYSTSGPVMSGYQCSPEPYAHIDSKPTFTTTDHHMSDCSDPPHAFENYRLGVCQLDMIFDNDDDEINENTEFQYVKYIACSNEKRKYQMVTYSDSQCQRPLYMSVESFDAVDNFMTCSHEEDWEYGYVTDSWYVYGKCSDSAEGYVADIVDGVLPGKDLM